MLSNFDRKYANRDIWNNSVSCNENTWPFTVRSVDGAQISWLSTITKWIGGRCPSYAVVVAVTTFLCTRVNESKWKREYARSQLFFPFSLPLLCDTSSWWFSWDHPLPKTHSTLKKAPSVYSVRYAVFNEPQYKTNFCFCPCRDKKDSADIDFLSQRLIFKRSKHVQTKLNFMSN